MKEESKIRLSVYPSSFRKRLECMSDIARTPRVQKVTVVLNPMSGRGQGAQRRPELEQLLAAEAAYAGKRRDGGRVDWEIVETTAPGNGAEQAAQAVARGADIVAAAGGDGTLGEVVNGLVGTGAKLGLLPFGTGNDCARYLGFGTDLKRACHALFSGESRPVDLGYGQGRWFINVAGCGFDAVVAARVNRGFRSLRGTSAYIAAVVQSLATFRAAQFRLTLDGETRELRAMMCSIANTTSYGGGMRIAPDAAIDDGLFDLCILGDVGRVEFLRAFPRVFKGTHTTHPKVTMLRARHIIVESDPPLPVLIDGDVFGTTPADFTLSPRAIEILTLPS
jgi:diacylglycerol kinase (ATP)